MFLTNRARYAVMGVLEMASREPGSVMKLADIAKNQEIDISFLEQIFARLKKSGFLVSTRGPGGGYKLSKSIEDISIAEIIKAVSEDIKITRCKDKSGCMSSGKVMCTAHHLWHGLEEQIEGYFTNKTIYDVLNHSRAQKPRISRVYFDNNATVKMLPSVRDAMLDIACHPLNGSATHTNGRVAKRYIEEARKKVKKLVNADDRFQVVFTASGTEANNLAMFGIRDVVCLVSTIEHSSIMALVGSAVLEVDRNGVVDLELLEKVLLLNQGNKVLVSVMLANNETGVIQPLSEVAALAKKYGAIVHTDATQGPGKMKLDIDLLGVDMMTISAHKFGGPIGAAALIYKKELDLRPIIIGGGQEYRIRSGTHNVAAIHGFGVACDFEPQYRDKLSKTSAIRDYIESGVRKIANDALFFGQGTKRLPNTSSIGMPGVNSESQIMNFDLHSIAVSSGSACSSGTSKLPHVQMAMGYPIDKAKTAIRISLGIYNTMKEADKFLQIWQEVYLRANNQVKDAI